MGTSTRYRPENPCKVCGKNVANMSWAEQQEHIKKHNQQTKLF